MTQGKKITLVSGMAIFLFLIGGLVFGKEQLIERPFGLWTKSGNNIYNTNSGNVGIGITNPDHRLVVSGDDLIAGFYSTAQNARIVLNPTREDGNGTIIMGSEGGSFVISVSEDGIQKDALTINPQSGLTINNTITARELIVTQEGWPDFVFEEGYPLEPLNDLKAYIEEQGHLPNIPSAKEIESEGISVGAMQSKLLQKIEELTLYLIDQHEELSSQEQASAQLKSENEALRQRVLALELGKK
ncbi:MAG: hypothetical protein HY538_05485 [Deltaproteobacteria bacterium]|nr:hypothetical protein [Deltaproteobacteria bacterium]